LIGVIAEGRATSTLLLLPAAAWLIERARAAAAADVATPATGVSGARRALSGLVALVLGDAVITLPVAARNFAVGHEWIPFTYNLGFNFYAGNNPEATGAFTSITGTHRASVRNLERTDVGAQVDGREYLRKVEGVDLTPAGSSAHWAHKAVQWIRAHPQRALALTGRKLMMLWNRDDYPQIENLREYRTVAGPLGLPLGGFLVVGALAFAGILWTLRGGVGGAGMAARFATGYAVTMTLSIVPFFVTDR